MNIWAAPHWLYLLLGVPALVAALVLFDIFERRRLSRAIEPRLFSRLAPDRLRASGLLRRLGFVLALVFMILALARPRWGERLEMFRGRGVAVVIALDGSKSMLAEDVKPNRLERAKTELALLLEALAGNAAGIVAFAGDAYVLCPLTTDLEAAKLFLDIISPEVMPVPGTDFGRAIMRSLELFTATAPGTRALVLVTDGEDLGTSTEAAIQAAKAQGVRIYPVAFSTAEGAPIPEKGEAGVVYKKDRSGNMIISRMDERKLILMAQATGGRFYRFEGFSAARLAAELERLEKQEFSGGSFSGYVERYQPFLLCGILLLFFALSLPERLPEGLRRIRKVRVRGNSAAVLLLLAVLCANARADVRALGRAGNSLYRQGKYSEALTFYQRAEVLEPDALALHYNIGNTLYRLGRYDEAASELALATVEKNPRARSRAHYNLGNTFYRMGRIDDAIASYKRALLANPNDRQAKENLEFCLKKRSEAQPRDTTQNKNQPGGGGAGQRGSGAEQTPKPGIDREQAERILQAVESKERLTQQERRRPRARRQVEKDW